MEGFDYTKTDVVVTPGRTDGTGVLNVFGTAELVGYKLLDNIETVSAYNERNVIKVFDSLGASKGEAVIKPGKYTKSDANQLAAEIENSLSTTSLGGVWTVTFESGKFRIDNSSNDFLLTTTVYLADVLGFDVQNASVTKSFTGSRLAIFNEAFIAISFDILAPVGVIVGGMSKNGYMILRRYNNDWFMNHNRLSVLFRAGANNKLVQVMLFRICYSGRMCMIPINSDTRLTLQLVS